MKFLLCLLVLTPLVYSANIQERFVFGDLFGGGGLVGQLVHLIDSSVTHDGCVSLCKSKLHQSELACNLECTGALKLLSG